MDEEEEEKTYLCHGCEMLCRRRERDKLDVGSLA